jgi:hypothetical protein
MPYPKKLLNDYETVAVDLHVVNCARRSLRAGV